MPRGRAFLARLVAIFAAALGYWWAVARWGGVREPWDASGYWTIAFPVSLLLALVIGWLLRRSGWAGLAIALAQAPLALRGGDGSLWVAGLAILTLLSLPTVAAALAGASIARRRSG